MYIIIKKIIVVLTVIVMASCMRDSFDDCEAYLEFIFDYNMGYTDSFNPQVEVVDIYVFDKESKYLFSKQANRSELIGRKRMPLNTNEFIPGNTYRILTVGVSKQNNEFSFTDMKNGVCTPGITTIEEVKLALRHNSNVVSNEFPSLWFGHVIEINYQPSLNVWTIHLIRDTNMFNVTLMDVSYVETGATNVSSYTFDIIAPESGAYGWDNKPLVRDPLTYRPFYEAWDKDIPNRSMGKAKTMRLLSDEQAGYQLNIRHTTHEEAVWSYDLLELLKESKPLHHPDGSLFNNMQEYLDREGDWDIIILYQGEPSGSSEGFVAIQIMVNGWIVWKNNIDI